ncbi:Pyrrolocin cluster transcription factor fsdR [Colletotrichum aenigma]|uniref:Pyrrolocin cluster transcription factor fsdR n=1 Tax=Colletotrichum aenigma TaxID=1215731 RepID=UPI00187310A4|nr:Pyrrolocin cluster transcription factor fsdR [Colletotrichum aenigma]KAF5527280.1 Pyrrolocin cluster transcription factor fsdR [Colletotrichum aenigma]
MEDPGPSRETPVMTALTGNSATGYVPAVNSTPIEARDESSKTSESGSIRLNASEARYVGSSHWASILDGIAELKDHLEAEEEIQTNSATPGSIPAPEDDMEMPLLYSVRSASRAQILDSIPPKQVLDRYISHYFNTLDLASGAFHTGKFMREYAEFCQNPSETPIMWLGLLYSIMCMAVMSYDLVGKSEVEDPKALIDQYREKTAQCLLLGKYANGGQYTWETIYQYVIIELSSRRDITQTIGILHGVSMNLLLQMGYHRDPSHFPSISPFAGEIRRRNWVKCLEGDLQMSMRTGIPRRISAGHWDTEEPRNLHDSDFDEDTKEIPPSRSETEVTAVTQLIARRRMLVAVGAAVDLSSSIKPPAYTEVLAVDRQVREAEESLPPPLKMKPLQASVTDPPLLIMHRLYLALMFRIGEVMIHRKYLSEASDSFSYSRKKCLDSCLSVLQLQHTLNEETMVGGLLHFAGAKLSLIGNHAFLTACITLCGAMYKGLHAAGNEYASAREEDVKTALWNSLSAWMKNESSSREARIAAESIRLVLKKNGWFSELLPSPDLGSTSVNAMGLDSLGGFFGHGIDSFGEAPLTMFNNEWDPEGFPWFLDPLNGGMAIGDAAAASPPNVTAPSNVEAPDEPVAPANLEADDTENLAETASNIDDRISSYTASLSSSVLDYPTENGRRYHAFRAGSYLGPNDETEMDRLDFNHMLIMKAIGGKHFLAPVPQEETQRILDIGTGTGIWAVEVSDLFPNAEVLGNDFSAIQPPWVPPNVKFEIDDVESEWVYDHKFDFIFSRYMAASIKDWPKLVRNIHEHLNPNGWAEFQDYDIAFCSDDGTLTEEHHTTKWCNTLIDACNKIGHDPNPGPKLERWVKDAGFINVVHQSFPIPLGPWPKDPHYKDVGMTNLIHYVEGLEAFSLRAFCAIMGWTKEETLVHLAHVRREMKKGDFHAYITIHVVYGQKAEASTDNDED